jgi:hypothetical protein
MWPIVQKRLTLLRAVSGRRRGGASALAAAAASPQQQQQQQQQRAREAEDAPDVGSRLDAALASMGISDNPELPSM